jgi:hypothetical protein
MERPPRRTFWAAGFSLQIIKLKYDQSNNRTTNFRKIIGSWVVPFLSAAVCMVIALFAAAALYPYTRVVTIDLYSRSHLLFAMLFIGSIGISWILARVVRLKPELIRRTIWIAVAISGIPILMWISHEPALNRGAQKQTMADIRTIAKAIELFRNKNGSFPVASDIYSLEKILHSEIPKSDTWGTPFIFLRDMMVIQLKASLQMVLLMRNNKLG